MGDTMTAEELRQMLAQLGMVQAGEHGLDRFLNVGERTVRRWATEGDIPDHVAMLLRLMVDKKMKPAKIKATYGNKR